MFRLSWVIDETEIDQETFHVMGTAMDYARQNHEWDNFVLTWDGWGDKFMIGTRQKDGKIDWRASQSPRKEVE